MERNKLLSHDAIDAFVAWVFGLFEGRGHDEHAELRDVAFSDEWERKQIARELHSR